LKITYQINDEKFVFDYESFSDYESLIFKLSSAETLFLTYIHPFVGEKEFHLSENLIEDLVELNFLEYRNGEIHIISKFMPTYVAMDITASAGQIPFPSTQDDFLDMLCKELTEEINKEIIAKITRTKIGN
jgi:alpha-glucosidase (family GH31 glycosyl hydrolase)